MRTIISLVLLIMLFSSSLVLAQVKVIDVKGDVSVRHGVSREWQPIRVGDILKPEDSMKSGKRSSATIIVDGSKRIVLPENVIVDLSDFRKLTQEELLLKLAMERVRAVPVEEKRDGLIIPQTTVIHGNEKTVMEQSNRSIEMGLLQLNGTRVLYNGGYYATCALKAKEVLRLFPEFSKKIEIRLMIPSALEKENLNGEALTEYISLANEELFPKDRIIVQAKIAQLKKKS